MTDGDCSLHLEGLNDAQRQAVMHKDGPCLVLAGAGSGKTRVLTHRIAYLVCHGVDPRSIIAITFTNKAAREMRERLENLVGPVVRDMWIHTFHAACVRILRRYGDRVGYDDNFVIVDETEQRTILKECLDELQLNPDRYPLNSLRSRIDQAKNQLLAPGDLAERADNFYVAQVARVYEAYQKRLRAENALDFGDLLMQAVILMREHPDVRKALQDRFQYILVDEYQDTNHAQYVWLKLLAGERRNAFAVGDADQSIYGWRGADISNILQFEQDFPDARVILLERNYRSTQQILDAAHDVINNNKQRHKKKLWTDRTSGSPVTLFRARDEWREAEFVADQIERLEREEATGLSDMAVLYRTHAQSRVIEEVLMRRGIPYVIVGGQRFYDRQEIKDMLAYLRLVVNPYDRLAFERVINRPKRGLGPTSQLRLVQYAEANGISLIDACRQADQVPGLNRSQVQGAQRFGNTIAGVAQRQGDVPVADLIQELIETSGYAEALRAEGTNEALARIENLQQLPAIARELVDAGFDDTISDFLALAALSSGADEAGSGEAVSLMTLHSAKGLEFSVVFLVGLEEGLFPHVRSMDDESQLEEERRLCYVGMTRARDRLYLTHAWSRVVYGDFQGGIPSRFLTEIKPERLHEIDEGAEPQWAAMTPVRSGTRRNGSLPGTGRAPSTGIVGPAGPSQVYVPAAGAQVRHPKWGVGTVVSLSGEGGDAEIVIAFPGAGIKRVIARYARLEPA